MSLFFGKHKQKNALLAEIPFDRERQYAVIRGSICTGERTAGFKDRDTGHFTEVMVIRSDEDLALFRDTYKLTDIKTEY